LLKIKLINLKNISHCISLLNDKNEDLGYFKKIGWSEKEIINQSTKESNHSFGLFFNNKLIGFVIGNLIIVDNISEYEIFILYISKKFRKHGYASYLLDLIVKDSYKYMLKKIILEVSENNVNAIHFYKKNKFNLIGKRKKYYSNINNLKEDALIFEKNIN
tara:strand:+ start:198 stop:680 length:483 start_codon:yes stop_codon:yes gene_type:complete